MKLRFEAVAAMSPEDKEVAKAVLDAMIVKSQVTQAVEHIGRGVAEEKD